MDTDKRSRTDRSAGYANGVARRDHIVAVSTTYFVRMGYRAATMLQIAGACGISRAGLLHHFPTKESLLEAVLAERDRLGRERTLGSAAAGDGLGALADLVALVAYNATTPGMVDLFAVLSAEASSPDHPAHAYFVERYDRSRSTLAQAFVDASKQGVLAPGIDPAALALEMVALMDGLQIQWLLAPGEVDMAAHVRRQIELALTVPLPISDGQMSGQAGQES